MSWYRKQEPFPAFIKGSGSGDMMMVVIVEVCCGSCSGGMMMVAEVEV